MLAKFRSVRSDSRGKYTEYTCRPWPWIWSSPSVAETTARDGQNRDYNVVTDNCLHRSVDTLRQYGMSTLFDVGYLQDPSDYFNRLPTLHQTEGGHPHGGPLSHHCSRPLEVYLFRCRSGASPASKSAK